MFKLNKLPMILVQTGLLACISLSDIASAQTASIPVAPPTKEAREALTAQGLEQLAYSAAVQAYVFTLPLFIVERERLVREKMAAAVPGAPAAPINQFGHQRQFPTAKLILPYSPNHDTLYSGALLDLTKEPIVLHTPAVTDRFVTFEVANAYIDNERYVVSTRMNGGRSTDVAIVGPHWKGKLPSGVIEQRVGTNLVMIASRIWTGDSQEDKEKVHHYQDQMSLTALSEWKGKPADHPMAIPEPRARGKFTGEFAYYQRMAELLTETPPLERDEAMREVLKQVGLVAGKPFNADALSAATRTGLLRAAKDFPAIRDAIRLSRGVETPNHWRTNEGKGADKYGQYGLNYQSRAEMALVGLVSNDPEEAAYLQTFVDANGERMLGDNKYVLHLNKEQLPRVEKKGFWSITMYDALSFMWVENSINRYAVRNSDALKYNADGSLDIFIQPDSPGAGWESNWLPTLRGREFKTTVRMYAPVGNQSEFSELSKFPGIQPANGN